MRLLPFRNHGKVVYRIRLNLGGGRSDFWFCGLDFIADDVCSFVEASPCYGWEF